MRIIAILAFICAVNLSAQNFDWASENEYQNTANSFYWKNRTPHKGYWQQDVWYKINAKLDANTEVISGEEYIEYTNNSPNDLTQMYFHLYQNAVQPGGLVDQLYDANKTPHTFGKYESQKLGTEIFEVRINEQKVEAQVDGTIMKIKLPESLKSGSKVNVYVRFKTYFDRGTIRRRMKVYDHHGFKHFNGVHWYPRISVYDKKFSWEHDPHIGKEFYGNFGQYDVNLSLPNDFICEATGKNMNRSEVLPAELWKKIQIKNFKDKPLGSQPSVVVVPNGTYKTWKFHAINVHDFAWTADPTYRLDIQKYKDVECIALAQENNASGWQPSAAFLKNVVKVYSEDFGMYAYPKIVAADAADGMEYPMLTLDGGTYPGHRGLIAHEVGHNWFFGMVGTNETYRASMDEGFTQFLTSWSLKKLSPFKADKQIDYSTVYRGYMFDAMDGKDAALNTHSNDFNSATGHGGGYRHVYYKTATMLYNLEYLLGKDVFRKAMSHYFNQWKIAHPYTEDFRNSITEYTQTDLNWFFDQWLESTKYVDYAVGKVKHKKGQSIIEIKRKGSMVMPLDILLTKENGEKVGVTIPVSDYNKPGVQNLPIWKGWDQLNKNYYIYTKGKIKDVRIDLSDRLADINRLNNTAKLKKTLLFDKGNGMPVNYLGTYLMQWRPDIWYNHYDNVKLGLHFDGNYSARKHIVTADVWANPLKERGADDLNYAFSYKNQIRTLGFWNVRSKYMAGVWNNEIGIEAEQHWGNLKGFVSHLRNINKMYYSYSSDDLPFGYQSTNYLWNNDKHNITFNINYSTSRKVFYATHTFNAGLKTSLPGSDYQFSQANAEWLYNQKAGKVKWKNRFFASAAAGNVAPENMLYAAGANPAELWNNKYTRDLNPIDQNTGTAGFYNPLNFHLGGGLNLRGFQNYAIPMLIDGNSLSMARGLSGIAYNTEVDLHALFGFVPKVSWANIHPYIFADAGLIAFENGANTAYSDVLADAGIGLSFTIQNWNRVLKSSKWLRGVKPLTIRADFPLFLNNVPTSEEYVQFRWQLGINQAF